MIIDAHGHYTTGPAAIDEWRNRQLENLSDLEHLPPLNVSDEQIRESLELNQLKFQRERGSDVSFMSPRASTMEHHRGNAAASLQWSRLQNDLIKRICDLYPSNFVGGCMLPQFPGEPPENSIDELKRSVEELGFCYANLNPDPSGGFWREPPLTDRWWYPLYEAIVDLDVPVMVHVSRTANPVFHFTGSHYINADTTAFMQLLLGDLFKDFPTLKIIIPHGGGAAPYHWGRYRGLAQDNGKPTLDVQLLQNVYFDTCVYHLPGMECLFKVVPVDNILFASEMVGAVRGIDPETGHYYDDTKRYVDQIPLSDAQRDAVYEGNARKLYKRMKLPGDK